MGLLILVTWKCASDVSLKCMRLCVCGFNILFWTLGASHSTMAAQSQPKHLVVVHHGYGASAKAHASFCEQLQQNHPSALVINSDVNSAKGLMDEGIERCAERLAAQIRLQTRSTPTLESISMVGVSMGGLISRAT